MTAPSPSTRSRLIEKLPAIYAATDNEGHLAAMLQSFEEVLFGPDASGRIGIEQSIERLPGLFAPLGVTGAGDVAHSRTPERFLGWLAGWIAFSPYRLFGTDDLRRIIAGIVPLYGRRGTRGYLEALLRLCFPMLQSVDIRDPDDEVFVIGQARVGIGTTFGHERPGWFRVEVRLSSPIGQDSEARAGVERRARAIVEFAKPAHTACAVDIVWSDAAGSVAEA